MLFAKPVVAELQIGAIEMIKSKVEEINSAVQDIASSVRNDERIFELGMELGRCLATAGEKYERLEFFVRRDEERGREERVREKRKKISDLISRIFYLSCIKQIEINGSIKFDANDYWLDSTALLDAQVVDEFGIQCKSVTQEDDEKDFEIECEVVGNIGEIFENFEARKTITVSAYNLDSSSKMIVSNALELHEVLGSSWMFFDRSSAINDEERLDQLFEELNKATLFIQMKYSDV